MSACKSSLTCDPAHGPQAPRCIDSTEPLFQALKSTKHSRFIITSIRPRGHCSLIQNKSASAQFKRPGSSPRGRASVTAATSCPATCGDDPNSRERQPVLAAPPSLGLLLASAASVQLLER